MSESSWDEDDHHRELYARFGLAAYFAQVLEAGMVNLLTIAELFPEPSTTREVFESTLERHFRRNFRQLQERLARRLGVDQDLLDDLEVALPRRNFLIHRFWYERIPLTLTAEGRDQLIDELDGYRTEFSDLDTRVEAVLLHHAAVRGVTRDDILRLRDEQVAHWRATSTGSE